MLGAKHLECSYAKSHNGLPITTVHIQYIVRVIVVTVTVCIIV